MTELTPKALEDIKSCVSAGRKIITVINKSDLTVAVNKDNFPNVVVVSALTGNGLKNLKKKIKTVLALDDFDYRNAACFSQRQKQLALKISRAQSKQQIKDLIKQMING